MKNLILPFFPKDAAALSTTLKPTEVVIVDALDMGYLQFNLSNEVLAFKSLQLNLHNHASLANVNDHNDEDDEEENEENQGAIMDRGYSNLFGVGNNRHAEAHALSSLLLSSSSTKSLANSNEEKVHTLNYKIVTQPCIKVTFRVQFIIQVKHQSDPTLAYNLIQSIFSAAVFEVCSRISL